MSIEVVQEEKAICECQRHVRAFYHNLPPAPCASSFVAGIFRVTVGLYRDALGPTCCRYKI